jgi:hypothetical protein
VQNQGNIAADSLKLRGRNLTASKSCHVFTISRIVMLSCNFLFESVYLPSITRILMRSALFLKSYAISEVKTFITFAPVCCCYMEEPSLEALALAFVSLYY